MADNEPKRALVPAVVVFPPDVWRHIKYFLLREFWRRKYSELLATVPRATVLSTWTRRFVIGWNLARHPNFNSMYMRRTIFKIMVDYESRYVYPGPSRPCVLGPQEAFYVVVEQT